MSDPLALLAKTSDRAANGSAELSRLQEKLAPVVEHSNRLKVILFSMIGWIIVVTIALLVLVSIAFRHWRRQHSFDLPDSSTVHSVSVGDGANMADFETSVPVAKKKLKIPGTFTGGDLGPPLPPPLYPNAPALVFSNQQNVPSRFSTLSSGTETSSNLRPPVRLS